MTEQELRAKVVSTAQGYLGVVEGSAEHKKLVDKYNTLSPLPVGYKLTYGDDWCAATVSVVGMVAGMGDIIFPECGCQRMIELYKKVGRWREDENYVPSPGDICLYDWSDNGKGDNQGWADHVGIVVSVNNGVIRVLEGNLSNRVGYREIAVNAKYLRGFALPDYGSKATEKSPAAGTFIDTGGHWADAAIARCAKAGIIQGYSDGTFKPSNNVTRAEMAVICDRLLDFLA